MYSFRMKDLRALPRPSILAVFLHALILAVLAVLLHASGALGQTRETRSGEGADTISYDHPAWAPTIGASPLSGPIEIDGVVDEPAWLAVEPFTDFVQRDPNEGQPVSEKTEVRIVVGPDAL